MAKALANKMLEAYQNDNRENEAGRPALAKMILLQEVSHDLRKLAIQEKFMDMNGLSMVGLWLSKLPDGTFPNASLCKEMLHLLGTLHIDSDNLQRSRNLINVMRDYAGGCSGKLELQALAKQTIDKWDRTMQNVNTTYDKEGAEVNQHQYLQFKDRLKQSQAPGEQKMDKYAEIKKTQEGIVMPTKNNFDFIVHPETKLLEEVSRGGSGKAKETSNKVKLKKITDGLKRASKASYVNKRMATVKMDF